MSRTDSRVAPAASARVAAAWIIGPSASGSENGTPSSTRSAPASTYAAATAAEVSSSGKPPIMYGISAARPSVAGSGEGRADAVRAVHQAPSCSSRSVTSARSLSPRPLIVSRS